MSGGSYDYLFAKDGWDYLRIPTSLAEMRDRLAGLGYAGDAAGETDELLVKLRQVQVMVETRVARLAPIWKAVEWWDSGDSDETGVQDALAKYRGDIVPPHSSRG